VGDVKGNVQTCTKCTTTWVEMSYADWKRTVATINGLRRIPSPAAWRRAPQRWPPRPCRPADELQAHFAQAYPTRPSVADPAEDAAAERLAWFQADALAKVDIASEDLGEPPARCNIDRCSLCRV
jgi:hypothetical protein